MNLPKKPRSRPARSGPAPQTDLRSSPCAGGRRILSGLVCLALVFAGSASATTVFSDDFDDGQIDAARWPDSSGVGENDECGSVSDPYALKFQDSTDRYAQTRPLDVRDGGRISFQLRAGERLNPVCNQPEVGETLLLQYRIHDDLSWTTFAVYDHNDYASWTRVEELIPSAARTATTRFRWTQPDHGGGGGFKDNWAIDNLEIEAPDLGVDPAPDVNATGSIAFEGTAALDAFPCDPDTDRNGNGTADGKCKGSFSANVTGTLTGHHEGAEYTVSFNTVDAGGIGFATAMTGAFLYEEDCSAFNPNGIVEGEADGSGTVEIPSTAVEGRYRPPQTGLGHDVDGVEMTFTFEWDRRGNVVVVDLSEVTVTLDVDTGTDQIDKTVISGGRMRAVATFAPVPHGGGHAPTCDDPISVDGVFAGDLSVVHPTPAGT